MIRHILHMIFGCFIVHRWTKWSDPADSHGYVQTRTCTRCGKHERVRSIGWHQ